MKEVEQNKVKLVRFDCPPELFDTQGAYILRRKRIAVYKLDAIKAIKDESEKVYPLLAELVPQWQGVLDVETGGELANPETNTDVLKHLDTPQLTWIVKMLSADPGDQKPYPTPDRT